MFEQKLSKRVFVLKSDDCLKNHIDPSILPKEYGGSKTQAEMMQDFLVLEKQKRERALEYSNFKIEWSKSGNDQDEFEDVGNFHTLTID
jgi:hypothetical protein